MRRVIKISIKKVASKIRKAVKMSVILTISAIMILGIIQIVYRRTYSVILNGEVIGYTNDKVTLQKRINEYISKGDGEKVAFVEVKDLPTYSACMLKKNIETNDDEIFNKVVENGTKYYKYYAITDNNEEKAYLSTFAYAEEVVKRLKEKDSANAGTLGIVEKYSTAEAELLSVDDSVSKIYVKKEVKPVVTASSSSSGYKQVAKTVVSGTSVPTNIGITLMKPLSGVISSRFGYRSRDNHKGLDIAAPTGTAIKAAADGVVQVSGYNQSYYGYGNCLVVKCSSSVTIIYGHCNKVYVKAGESIVQGQVIAEVGSTGISTGSHLHFEIRYNGKAVDPQNYLYN